jgi:hypothetical protein
VIGRVATRSTNRFLYFSSAAVAQRGRAVSG